MFRRAAALLLLLVAAAMPAAAAAGETGCTGAQCSQARPADSKAADASVQQQDTGGNALLQHKTTVSKSVLLDMEEEEEDDMGMGLPDY
mmetsp:Transcript_27676/g.62961  ORF Transcript_27676/g.62961 Transcript_27676/m.62961 type:complete len:89 (+) Transcript_27676:97-363(+)